MSGGFRIRSVFAAAFAAMALGLSPPAAAQSAPHCAGSTERVALLVGNAAYATLSKLENPHRDTEALAGVFCGHGFTVWRHADLSSAAFADALDAFRVAASRARTAVVYYSGHGFSLAGRNYLSPVDARVSCEQFDPATRDLPLSVRRGLVDLNEDVLPVIAAAETQIVILDACRENPVAGCFRGGGAQGFYRGFTRANDHRARVILYATQDGQLAADRLAGHQTSPLAAAIRSRLPAEAGSDWLAALASVSEETFRLTERRQKPSIDVSLRPQGCLAERCGAAALPAPAPPADPTAQIEAAVWDALKASRDVEAIVRFAAAVTNPLLKIAAEARLRELKLASAAPTPAPIPVQPAPPIFNASRSAVPLTPAEERGLTPKDAFKECAECPEMVVVPAGTYVRGSPEDEAERGKDEGPQRRVTLPRAFAVGKFEVTFAEWDECVLGGGCNGHRPADNGWGRGRQPVMNVSWNDAQAYVDWLSRKTGKTYRLLTEAEWEYAARAGTTTAFAFGPTISPDEANYDGNFTYGAGRKGVYRSKAIPVGSLRANVFGLFDMHGNVWEWVADCYRDSYATAPMDGSAISLSGCSNRVLRGGSWINLPRNLRSAIRYLNLPVIRDSTIGFRLARTLSL